METSEAYVALANQFQKAVKTLTPAGAVALAEGQSTFVIMTRGQRAIQDQPD